jgi:hypothetical protein
MEDFDKYLDRLVGNFYDTGKLVLNEWSDLFYHNNQYSESLWAHLQDLKKSGDDAVNKQNREVAIEKYEELLTLYDDDEVMDDNDRHNIITHKYNSIDIEEVRHQLIILRSPEPEEEEVSSQNFRNINNKIALFFRTFKETNGLFMEGIWKVMCDSNNGTQEECFNKLKAYIEIVNRWYGILIPLLGEMDEEDLQFSMFKSKRWSDYNEIDVLVKEMGKMYMVELQKTYQFALNKIHDLTKKNEDKETELSDVELSIDYYRELKNIISIMSSQLPYNNKEDWNRRVDDNLFNNIRSKIIFKKTEDYDIHEIVGMSNELRKIIDGADEKLIEFIIVRLKKTKYFKKSEEDHELPLNTKEDVITWLSKFRQKQYTSVYWDKKKQYFKQFEDVVEDIEVKEIDDDAWGKSVAPLLDDFSVDNEEVNKLIKLIKEKEKKLTDLEEERNNGNDINHGKVQIPELQLEIPQLKEQLKLIDPIKEFFVSSPEWRKFLTWWKYCPEESKEEYEKINKFLTKSYGQKTNYENTLLSKSQILQRKKPYDATTWTVTVDCDKFTVDKLKYSLKLKNKRESLQEDLINKFEENQELVLKCIRLVDEIFMSIIENRVYEQSKHKDLLKKYKSYINMIKIYSEGENQREKLFQLIYDLDQLKSVVDSYDSLKDEATQVSTETNENDGRGLKLLTKNTLRDLLKNISFNSWDANEIKEYFVAVREHKNVAYEKSFAKECDDQKYFKRVDGGNNPAIVSGNNNIILVNELIKKDDNDTLLPVSTVTETIFGKVRELLDREASLDTEDLENSKLKKYDIKTTQNVTLTPYNREGENITIEGGTFIEVKDAKPADYHFSEFFGVYKNKKVTDTAYNTITTIGDPEENKARYEKFVEELVFRLNGDEGETIINTIKSRIGGIFFENYLFSHIDDITFSWSPTGQGTSRENRVSIRVIPDMNNLYYWKEGNSNCNNNFKYTDCEENPGCSQNESTDQIDNIIENFFDTGKFVI